MALAAVCSNVVVVFFVVECCSHSFRVFVLHCRSLFYSTVLSVLSCFGIILLRRKSWLLYFYCLLDATRQFLFFALNMVPRVGLQCVPVIFSGHTHLRFKVVERLHQDQFVLINTIFYTVLRDHRNQFIQIRRKKGKNYKKTTTKNNTSSRSYWPTKYDTDIKETLSKVDLI